MSGRPFRSFVQTGRWPPRPTGQVRFCALRLAQRHLDLVPAGNCKLQTLRQYYRLPERGAHTALGDVLTVVDLFSHVLRPIAGQRGLETWEARENRELREWLGLAGAFVQCPERPDGTLVFAAVGNGGTGSGWRGDLGNG